MADIIKDITIPSTGAITIKITIFITPAITTDLQPELATAAPTSPPTRVWEELEGKPKPPCRKIPRDCCNDCRSDNSQVYNIRIYDSVPIVVATLRGKIRKATKLKKEAIATAARGERTFVETTVAIEFAES